MIPRKKCVKTRWNFYFEIDYKLMKFRYMGEGSIMLHMLDIFPMEWRTAALTLNVLVLYVWLQKLGKPNWKIWEIFKISVAFGFLISFIRCQCEAHRILPAVHNGAYYYIGIGGPMLILSIRWGREANENFIEKPKIS